MSHAGSGRSSPEALKLVHYHPGRLRLRAHALEEATELGAHACQVLTQIQGVQSVVHNPRTGSVLIDYEPGQIESDELIRQLAEATALGVPNEDFTAAKHDPAVALVDTARALNAVVYELTGSRADLHFLIPAGLAAWSVYSFAAAPANRLPRWDNLAYWAYSIFLTHHPKKEEPHREHLHTP